MKLPALSYSALKQFDTCPKQFWYQRIDRRLPQLPPSEALIYGNTIHEQLQQLLKRRELPTDGDLLAARETMKRLYALEDRGGKLLIEYEIALDRDRQMVDWWSRKAWLRAKIDAGVVMPDGRCVLIDWKTGKYKVDELQLRLFGALAHELWSCSDIVACYVFLTDERLYSMRLTPEDAKAAWKALAELEDKMRHCAEIGTWPAKPGPLCRWCLAQEVCDDYHMSRLRPLARNEEGD